VLCGCPLPVIQKILEIFSLLLHITDDTLFAEEDVYGFTGVHYAALVYKRNSDVLECSKFESRMNTLSQKLKITPALLRCVLEQDKEMGELTTHTYQFFDEKQDKIVLKPIETLQWGDSALFGVDWHFIATDLVTPLIFKKVFKEAQAATYTEYTPPITGEANMVIAKVYCSSAHNISKNLDGTSSGELGFGAFAACDFCKDDVICHFLGKIDVSYCDFTFNDNYGIANDDVFVYGQPYRCLAMMMNHSRKHTNVDCKLTKSSFVPRIEMVALKDIKKGDQLFIDYGHEWFEARELEEVDVFPANIPF